SAFVRVHISLTRLPTKVPHASFRLIHDRAVDESDQQNTTASGISILFFTFARSLAPIVQPKSSSLGIVDFFTGATLDLAWYSCTDTFSSNLVLRNTTAA